MIQWAGPFVRAGASLDRLRTRREGTGLGEIFRAIAAPRRPATGLSGLVPSVAGDDVSGEPARTALIAPTAGRRRGDPGRGINVFKGLQEIFRATATAGRLATVSSGLVPSVAGDDVTGEPARTAPIAPIAGRGGRNPGRGINVFNGLREIFRAIAAPRRPATGLSGRVLSVTTDEASVEPAPTASS